MPHVEPGLPGVEPGMPRIQPGFPHVEPGIPHIEPPRVTADTVRRDFNQHIQTNPTEALRGLSRNGQVLPPQERAALAVRVIDHLAVKVEAGNALEALHEVRGAREGAEGLDPALMRSLDAMARVAERRVMDESVRAVQTPAEKGQWVEAGNRAGEGLGRLKEVGQGNAEHNAARAEVQDALTRAAEVGQRSVSLDRVQKWLEGDPSLRLANQGGLPEGLRTSVEALRGVAELREAAAGRWEKPPDAARIRENVAALDRALAQMPGADVTLGKRVLQDLAVKALLDGHPAEFTKLWPADGPADHAATLLRDMKALTLGAGTVETWPGERTLAADPVAGGDGNRGPPPALKPLIPEGARDGWRPPVREAAKSDLPPVEKAAALSKPLQERAAAELQAERVRLGPATREAGARVATAHEHLQQLEADERKRLAEVEAVLDRPLEPAERARVLPLLAQNQQAAAVAASLQNPADEDEAFFQDVSRRLGRPLSDAERDQARRMRLDGRLAAEVAAVLRGKDAPAANQEQEN
jgi:hypothetical protein